MKIVFRGKMISRGWIIRGVSVLCVGFLVFVYYLSSVINSPGRTSVNSFLNNNNEERANIFTKFFYGRNDDSRQKTSDDVIRRRGHDPRKNLKHKVVHLDLKGMPPLVQYFRNLFPLLKQSGVTGLLIEYEDMFPYHGKLRDIANRESYSKANIKKLNELAKLNNLQVIPLIQTFGHLEFLLKLEKFSHLREVPRFPQAVCPTRNQSNEVIREMIDQVMSLHPGIEYFHIGSDEVYHIGQCSLCIERMAKSQLTSVDLFLDHVTSVAQYIKDSYDVRPLMWDDQFRSVDEELIVKSGIGSLVEIVVWDYLTTVKIQPQVWDKYSRTFQSVWIGSSFKGANEPNSMVVNETQYLANHYSWVDVMQEQESRITFQGVMLTGWQRYDHFSVPCELLPSAVPSLISCMTYLNTSKPVRMDEVFTNVSEILDCTTRLEYCHFPGSSVHQEIKHLYRLQLTFQRIKKSNIYLGWTNRANLLMRFSSPSYIDQIFSEVSSLKNDVQRIEAQLENSLREVFPEWSVNEWMFVNYLPLSDEIHKLYMGLSQVIDQNHFPVRPLVYPGRGNRNHNVVLTEL